MNVPFFTAPVRDAASKFLREHAAGAPLFPAGALASDEARARRARALDRWAGDRAALAAFLAGQNPDAAGGAPLSAAQRAHLAAAARPDALFVLTGQQPGLLGGPALALHKALSAIAHAREAGVRLGRPVIPVFWIAGDDSDLAESNAAEFLEPGASPSGARLEFPDADDAIPMSLRVLDAARAHALRDALPASWSPAAHALASACYAPGRSLTEAFHAVLQTLLGEQGLLFVDGFAAARLPAAQAVLRRVTEDVGGFHAALLRGTARLRESLALPPQVPVRPGAVPVFLFENGRRARLFASDSGRVYAAGDEGVDLRATLADKTLLHSALTRPLVVDSLFPTLGHILGPAELRYFAQIADVFPAFGCGFPALAPRQQSMLVPRAGLAALEALGFRGADLPDLKPSRVRAQLTDAAWRAHPAAAAFPDGGYAAFRAALADYEAARFPRAGNRFDAARRKLDRALGHYRDAARAQVFTETAQERFHALQPLLRWLAGGSQDRHLNTLSLWNALETSGVTSSLTSGLGGFSAYAEALVRLEDQVLAFTYDAPEGAFP